MMRLVGLVLVCIFATLKRPSVFASRVPRCNWPSNIKEPHFTRRIVKFYRQRRTRDEAESMCLKWGEMSETPVAFSAFPDRRMLWIKILRSGGCSIGFFSKDLSNPDNYFLCEVSRPKRCKEVAQQRVLPLARCQDCNKSLPENNWEVVDWEQDPETEWRVKNSGDDLEITIHPVGSLRTKIRITGEEDFLYVKKIRIKWKGGSEHSFGSFKMAGELQVFHERHDRIGGNHALSFLISERNNPPNPAWSDFLHKVHHRCNIIGSITELKTPPKLRNLLGEDAARPGWVRLAHRLLKYTRYTGTTTETPCEKYIWTVFDNALHLSRAQLTSLRVMNSFPTSSSTSAKNWEPPTEMFCQTRRTLS